MAKRLLTGLQPSGQLHIGNYFGALKPFASLYKDYESFLMVVDYHALTSLKDPAALRTNIMDVVRDYLAVGIDSTKAIIFKQSDVPEHTELAWIFECLVTVPFMMKGHAFKAHVDKVWSKYMSDRGLITIDEYLEARKKDSPKYDDEVERMFSGINLGLLNYPMLMAADILLYDTDVVPVGEDQRQHIEYAREVAAKFNHIFSESYPESYPNAPKIDKYEEFFKAPQELIIKNIGIVPGTDGRKMSKSYGNTIPLFGSKDEIAKAVMSVVTDSGPEAEKAEVQGIAEAGIETGSFLRPINLFRIHNVFKSREELSDLYQKNQSNYKALKEALIEDIEAMVAPMRAKRDSITDEEVKRVLKDGAERARTIASAKMAGVRHKVGVTL